MNIEKTLPKIKKEIQKKEEDKTEYDKLFDEFSKLDKDLSELVEDISLKGYGYKINQKIFDGYSVIVKKYDQIKALNIEKSRYEDLENCINLLEDIYFELSDIDDGCIKEPISVNNIVKVAEK